MVAFFFFFPFIITSVTKDFKTLFLRLCFLLPVTVLVSDVLQFVLISNYCCLQKAGILEESFVKLQHQHYWEIEIVFEPFVFCFSYDCVILVIIEFDKKVFAIVSGFDSQVCIVFNWQL